MASKILLISVNTCRDPYPVFPLGLAFLDGALRRAGHETRWHDVLVDGPPLEETVRDFRPDFIGVSLRNIDDILVKRREAFHNGLRALRDQLRAVTQAPIILGGSGYSLFPEALLDRSGMDYGLQGEAEESLVALVQALETSGPQEEIPGLVRRVDGRLVRNPKRSVIRADRLPLPARPQTMVESYRRASTMLNVQTQRGCAFECGYCTYPVLEGRFYRRRPVAEVVGELKELERGGTRYAFIVDSVFNSTNDHVQAVCEEMLRQELRLKWCCFLRPQGLTPELMRLMARAGLAHIEFGTDSFCDEVLAEYGKWFTFEDILGSSELARQEKVDYCHFLISGGPGETLATMRQGFANSLRLPDPVILALAGMRVYHGTALYQRALREGLVKPEEDLLEPRYYFAPGMTDDLIFSELASYARQAPQWLVGDPPAEYMRMVDRLRAKGQVGPLWAFFATMQRLALHRLVQPAAGAEK